MDLINSTCEFKSMNKFITHKSVKICQKTTKNRGSKKGQKSTFSQNLKKHQKQHFQKCRKMVKNTKKNCGQNLDFWGGTKMTIFSVVKINF